MKKFKDKLGKGSSHISMIEWTKHDDKMLDYIINNEENKLRLALLRKGVSPLKKKSDGKTLLDVACERGHVDCLGVLLERCADVISVSKAGSSALHIAAKSGNSDCVVKLLTYKVRVCSQDVDKMTALHHAASKGHVDCVKVLIANGSKLNIRDKDGRTPLLIAIQAAREAIVRLLVENGAKVNLTDSAHKTPLMYASLIGLKDAVSTLLRHGANPLMRDTNGHQAEDFARISGYDDIVKMISNTPVLPNWSNAEEYEDDEDTPSQDGSVLESNDGSDVASILSHPDSDHGFGSVYSGERRLSSNSLSTSVSSSSAVKHESTIGRVQELERENNRLNVQLRTLRLEQSKTVECNNTMQTMSNTVKDSATIDHTIVRVNALNNKELNDNQASVDLTDGDQRQLEILYEEINTLRRENERLTNEKDDINVDDSIPTIPITVYQQLKASAEEELSALNVSFLNIKKENENLKRQLSDLKRDTQDEMLMKAEQKIRALEKQVKRLQKQLVVADCEHSKTISVYRLHLLSAIQGAMNTDVKKALELILKIRFDEQFC